MPCAFWENFGENFRRERPKIVCSRSRKTRMKPSKIGNPLPKSQLDFESFSLRPLRYISKINLIQYSKKAGCRQHFSPCAVQKRGAAARIVSTQFKVALHKKQTAAQNAQRSLVKAQRLWICSAVALLGGLGQSLVVHFLGDLPSHGKLGVLADGDVLE